MSINWNFYHRGKPRVFLSWMVEISSEQCLNILNKALLSDSYLRERRNNASWKTLFSLKRTQMLLHVSSATLVRVFSTGLESIENHYGWEFTREASRIQGRNVHSGRLRAGELEGPAFAQPEQEGPSMEQGGRPGLTGGLLG